MTNGQRNAKIKYLKHRKQILNKRLKRCVVSLAKFEALLA